MGTHPLFGEEKSEKSYYGKEDQVKRLKKGGALILAVIIDRLWPSYFLCGEFSFLFYKNLDLAKMASESL